MLTLPRPARYYVAIVAMLGAGLCVPLVARAPWSGTAREPLFWWMIAFAVAGEVVPLRVPFRGDSQRITLSTTFVFVLLLAYGTGVAVGAQVVVSVADDVLSRKPWFKTVFNASTYAIAVSAAGLVHYILAGNTLRGTFRPIDLVSALVAGAVFYVVNNLLTSGVIAVAHKESLLDVLRTDLLFQGATSIVLFTQAPLVVAVALDRVWLLPLFIAPITAVYRAAQISVQRDHRALHDSLTELPNRDHLSAYLDREVGKASSFAIAFVDIDAFGEINNTLGHSVGDALLVCVAERLRAELPDAFCARVGGDEFAVVERDVDGEDLGHRLQALFETPFQLVDLPFALEASIGLATASPSSNDATQLLQQVDVALGVAKRRKSGLEVYRPAIDGRDPRRLALLRELRTALDENQFVLHYQPKISLTSRCVEGAEALVRWQHPQRGLLPPDEFIPLVESTSLIGQFTRHVARLALEECAAWRRLGLDLSVAVNVSPRNLADNELLEQLTTLLGEVGLTPDALEVEITESAAMEDVQRAISELARLRAAGITVALDDFGTGHSSLTHLHRLPIDVVKIDKSFVFDMESDEDAADIVATIVHLSHTRSLRVVAEGVESGAAWERLAALGCDSAQGYYISRPLSAERFHTWLAMSSFTVRRLAATPPPSIPLSDPAPMESSPAQ